MTQKDWRVRVEDMLEAMARIESYVDGMDAKTFVADTRTQDAVIRNLEILGEAVKRIPHDMLQRHPQVPWSRLGDIRNILVHEYHSVDPEIVLDCARNDLPPLVAPLKSLLSEGP